MRPRASFLLVSVLLAGSVWASVPASLPGGDGAAGGDRTELDRMERRDPIARPVEIEAAMAWLRERLTGPAPGVAFTFVYDGRPSKEWLGSWERREATRELDPKRTEHTVAYQFHRPDLKAGMAVAFRRSASTCASARVRLRGLDLDGRYTVHDRDGGTSAEASGHEMMGEGILISIPERPGSAIVEYRRM